MAWTGAEIPVIGRRCTVEPNPLTMALERGNRIQSRGAFDTLSTDHRPELSSEAFGENCCQAVTLGYVSREF